MWGGRRFWECYGWQDLVETRLTPLCLALVKLFKFDHCFGQTNTTCGGGVGSGRATGVRRARNLLSLAGSGSATGGRTWSKRAWRFKKSTLPQNRQLNISICNSKQ